MNQSNAFQSLFKRPNMNTLFSVLLIFVVSLNLWPLVVSSLPINVGNITQETICALRCHVNLDCWAYHFKELNQFFLDGNPENSTGNCIHLTRQELMLGDRIPSIPEGFSFKYLVQSNISNFTQDLTHKITDEEQILNTGFNQSITVGHSKIFFMEVIANHTYVQAMEKCLSVGAILPMENSDEFVEQMSNLSGNATAPRFISLAQEKKYIGGVRRLVWTLGLVEWEEGENITKCPRCQNWDFAAKDIQWVKIDPVKKLYERVAPAEITSKYYCQYLGGNLATNKTAVATTQNKAANGPEKAVDGDPFGAKSFWQGTYVGYSSYTSGQWIAVDLGAQYTITNVLFLAQTSIPAIYNREMTVWIDGLPPVKNKPLKTDGRTFCAFYPHGQIKDQLSGVTCQNPIKGHLVILHFDYYWYTHLNELVVFGFREELMPNRLTNSG